MIGLVIALAAALSSVAHAAPTVDIKARTRLALTKVRELPGNQVDITGQLLDKLTADGLSGQPVSIAIGGQTQTAITGLDGTFHAVFAAQPGPVQVALGFGGTRELDRADPLTADTDPAKQQLVIAIAKVADVPAGAELRVTAMSDDGLVAVPIALSIAPQGSDVFRPLRPVNAHDVFTLSRLDAGGPGIYRLRAAFVGNDHAQPASREVLIELVADTTTVMQLASAKLAYEDDLVATGIVHDADGQPVDHAAVTLVSGDRRLAQSTTNQAGRYKLSVEAQAIVASEAGPGAIGTPRSEIAVQVQADPGTSYVRPSHSDPVTVRIADPQPVPVSWTIAAFVATGLAAGAFFLARKKPWRRAGREPSSVEAPADAGDEPALGGLVAAKPGIVSTLRRAADEGFTGVVRDTVRARPLPGAVVTVELARGERQAATTGADGAFAFEGLPAGDWTAEVAADGHVTERFALTVPHRGELRGVRVDLVPVRERVFQLYRRAAEPVLPEPRLWGVWSPRQIVDHVRAKRPTPALIELTDFVEEVYFSPRVVAESVLPLASERVDRAIQERAPRAASSA